MKITSTDPHVIMIDNVTYPGLYDLNLLRENMIEAQSTRWIEHVVFSALTFNVLIEKMRGARTYNEGYAAGYEDAMEDKD